MRQTAAKLGVFRVRKIKNTFAIAQTLPLPSRPPPHALRTPRTHFSTEAIAEKHDAHWDGSADEQNERLPEPSHLSQHSLMKSPCMCKSGYCKAIGLMCFAFAPPPSGKSSG